MHRKIRDEFKSFLILGSICNLRLCPVEGSSISTQENIYLLLRLLIFIQIQDLKKNSHRITFMRNLPSV